MFQKSVVTKIKTKDKLTIFEYGGGHTISMLLVSLVVTPTVEVEAVIPRVEVEVVITSMGVLLRIQHRAATHEQT